MRKIKEKKYTMEELGLNELDSKDRTLYLIYESSHSRLERIIQKLVVIIILLICLFTGSIISFVWYENQFIDVQTSTTIEATQDGNNNRISGGDMYYEPESEDN